MADNKIRVGVVGASASYGWGYRAHLPAIQALPEYKITAVCTSSAQTAVEAQRAYRARYAFHDYRELANCSDVDLVVVCVRAHKHPDIVRAALQAGKHVFCEWPLGAELKPARELTDLARRKGVRTLVGLQGHGSPALQHVHNLIAKGYLGTVLGANMAMAIERYPGYQTPEEWAADPEKGSRVLWIHAGHAIDAFCLCAGEFREIAGRASTHIRDWKKVHAVGDLPPEAPDAVIASGLLANGATATVSVLTDAGRGTGWRMEVWGDKGTMIVSCPTIVQYGAITISAARAGEDVFRAVDVPRDLTLVPDSMPKGPPYNVGQLYRRLAEAIRTGGDVQPNFDYAVRRLRMLDAIAQSSRMGKQETLSS
ncbi:MAG: Gfo/Idh/MocA family oxidoreductase [Chloroflexi bacterium]|nr:Gfo/Idh/MocA family oxidoreductase [Chloroflexota bacterium]